MRNMTWVAGGTGLGDKTPRPVQARRGEAREEILLGSFLISELSLSCGLSYSPPPGHLRTGVISQPNTET